VIQDIPKLYTALAEWLACVLFVRLLPQRYNAAKTAGILAAALPLFGLVQWLIGIVPLSLWIPGMIVALVLMYATIWLCCRLNFCDTGFWWALAFTLAEFVASLEWQLYSLFCWGASGWFTGSLRFGNLRSTGPFWQEGLVLFYIWETANSSIWIPCNKRLHKERSGFLRPTTGNYPMIAGRKKMRNQEKWCIMK